MDKLKDKKVIAIIIVMVILFSTSIIIYGKNNNKIFSDQYMKNIFVEDGEEIEGTEKIVLSENNKEVLLNTKSEDLNLPKIVVEIKGEVLKPDVYELDEGSIVKDLIEMAGGLTEDGDTSNINRAKKLQNHELVIVLNKNDENNNITVFNENSTDSNNLININSADINDLKKITGIGDVKAQSIKNYREKNGGFKSIDEIKNVDGIGEKTFEKIKEEITL